MSLRNVSRGVVAITLSAAGLGPTARAAEAGKGRIFITGPAAQAVVRALDGARRKLANPACQKVLTDFTDPEGRTLRENLGPIAPADYLGLLVIRDGEIPKGSGRCAHPAAGAFTERGSGVVFVCAGNFARQGPRLRENALIHEMLHSLGLGENPPSSKEISRQVEQRCGV